MSARRVRRQRQMSRALGLVPTPRPGATEAVRLALRVRAGANLTGRCACGAVAEVFEVEASGALRRAPGLVHAAKPGRVYIHRFQHEDDCPAVSSELERAAARGEVADPAGDLLASLRRRGDEEAA